MSSVICRACLSFKGNLYSLIQNETAWQAFSDLTGIIIEHDDNLPMSICKKCCRMLIKFSEFRIRVIRNNDQLRKSNEKLNTVNKLESDKLKKEIINNSNAEANSIKTESQPTVKQEIEVLYLDTVETFNDETDNLTENIAINKKKKRAARVKKKTEISKETQKTKRARVYIHVDPAKITVIRLSCEEQRRRQRAEAERPEYKQMPFKCERCFKGFNYERKLQSHIVSYHKTDSEFECSVCSRTMSNAASLGLHVKKHELLYQCNICKASFVEKPRAISHFRSAHEGVQAQFPCKQCEKVFRSTLYGHVRSHHPSTERPACELCSKTFVSKDSYDDHMLIHTGEKNYSCDTCGARFRLRQCARAHQRSHSTARRYYCAPCDAAFKSRSAHAHHLATARRHVARDATRENTCTTCGRQFSTRHALLRHAAGHAGGHAGARARAARAGAVRCVCHYCGRGFAARRTLDEHIAAHTGARPHACVTCGARFTQRGTLGAHVRRRHGQRGDRGGARGQTDSRAAADVT